MWSAILLTNHYAILLYLKTDFIIICNQLNSHINEEIDKDLIWFCYDYDSLLSTLLFQLTFGKLLILGLVL